MDDSAEKANNSLALAGFVIGLVSFLLFAFPLLALIGVGFSGFGLGTFDEEKQHRRWMAWWGLGLSLGALVIFAGSRS